MFTIAFWTILNVYQSVIAEPIVVDRVIAVVNGEAILASELQTSLAIQSLNKSKRRASEIFPIRKKCCFKRK